MSVDEAAAVDAPSENWLTDMVVTELRRRYPDGVGKGDLEELTGAGPGQLREAINALAEEGAVVSTDDSYVYVQVEDRALGQTLSDGDAEEEEAEGPRDLTPDEVITPDPALAVGADAATGDTRYTTTLIIEVSSFPELQEDEDSDAAVIRESTLLAEAASSGILSAYPSLPVAVSVAKIEAFDNPRTVFPA